MIENFFNSSLEIGTFLNATTSNVTGSDFITFLIVFVLFFCAAIFFHMPEFLFAVVIAPLVVVFGLADPSFGTVTMLMFISLGVMLAIRMILFR